MLSSNRCSGVAPMGLDGPKVQDEGQRRNPMLFCSVAGQIQMHGIGTSGALFEPDFEPGRHRSKSALQNRGHHKLPEARPAQAPKQWPETKQTGKKKQPLQTLTFCTGGLLHKRLFSAGWGGSETMGSTQPEPNPKKK